MGIAARTSLSLSSLRVQAWEDYAVWWWSVGAWVGARVCECVRVRVCVCALNKVNHYQLVQQRAGLTSAIAAVQCVAVRCYPPTLDALGGWWWRRGSSG
jgi:hypothetical protein